jgi:hypothetical protein
MRGLEFAKGWETQVHAQSWSIAGKSNISSMTAENGSGDGKAEADAASVAVS